MNFIDKVKECIENDKRHLVKDIPMVLLNSCAVEPDWLYWMEYGQVNKN